MIYNFHSNHAIFCQFKTLAYTNTVFLADSTLLKRQDITFILRIRPKWGCFFRQSWTVLVAEEVGTTGSNGLGHTRRKYPSDELQVDSDVAGAFLLPVIATSIPCHTQLIFSQRPPRAFTVLLHTSILFLLLFTNGLK